MNDFDGELNKSLDDFMESYKMVDTEEIYSNGTEFVPIFRIKQWEEYNNKDKEIERLMSLWEFDRVSWNELMAEKETEIERLNNIINELKWKPIEEYDKGNYDWVLVKYFDGNYECIPCVAEKRFGKWHSIDEKEIQFDVKYFMDMQQIDKLQELKGSDKE